MAQIHWSERRQGRKGISGDFSTRKDLTQPSKTVTMPGGRLLASMFTQCSPKQKHLKPSQVPEEVSATKSSYRLSEKDNS